MKFRLGARYWLLSLLLFLMNMIVLMLRIPQGSGIDIRIFALMAASSAVVAFLTALLLLFLFDRISRASRTRQQ
jgi:hypothetical protein